MLEAAADFMFQVFFGVKGRQVESRCIKPAAATQKEKKPSPCFLTVFFSVCCNFLLLQLITSSFYFTIKAESLPSLKRDGHMMFASNEIYPLSPEEGCDVTAEF